MAVGMLEGLPSTVYLTARAATTSFARFDAIEAGAG